MHIDKVNITSNDRTIVANVVSKSDDHLQVWVPAADLKLTLTKRNGIYSGTKAGMEFTSTGRFIR